MTMRPVKTRLRRWRPSRRFRPHRNHFALIVMPACQADVVRTLQFTAIRAFDVARRLERVMGAAHVATRLRGFFLRNSHGITRKKGAPRRGLRVSVAKNPRSRNPPA